MKELLYFIPYTEFYPPKNGGMLRNYFLCYELSKYFKVTVLTFQHASTFADGLQGYQWNKAINVVTIPVNTPGNRMEKVFNSIKGRVYQRNLFAAAGSYSLYTYPVLKTILQEKKYDVIVLPHLWTLSLLYLIKQYAGNSILYFDAHNVDHLLYAQGKDLSDSRVRRHYEQIKKEESTLYRKVDYFLACSEKDREILEKLNKERIKGFVIPNGADTYQNKFRKDGMPGKRILFCGSLDYEPNKDGLFWFFESIWPFLKKNIPEIRLSVIGRNGSHKDYDRLRADNNIDFIGEVNDVKEYYYSSNVAIVPLRKGSGTRLKILEAMSLGVPIVSTSIGAEGIHCSHCKHIYLADSATDFANGISMLLHDERKINTMRLKAKELIDEEYSWPVIGKKLAEIIEKASK